MTGDMRMAYVASHSNHAMPAFYKFAAYLRDGRPVPEALYRAYGAPYTRIRALEIAWRHEVSRGTLAKLPAGN